VDRRHANSTCNLEIAAIIPVDTMNVQKIPKSLDQNLWEPCYQGNTNVKKRVNRIFHVSKVQPWEIALILNGSVPNADQQHTLIVTTGGDDTLVNANL
jgi:hypothetical protein